MRRAAKPITRVNKRPAVNKSLTSRQKSPIPTTCRHRTELPGQLPDAESTSREHLGALIETSPGGIGVGLVDPIADRDQARYNGGHVGSILVVPVARCPARRPSAVLRRSPARRRSRTAKLGLSNPHLDRPPPGRLLPSRRCRPQWPTEPPQLGRASARPARVTSQRTPGSFCVAELDAAEGEEVEITVGDGEVSVEPLVGATEIGVVPSEAEHAPTRATITAITSNPEGPNFTPKIHVLPPSGPRLRRPGSRANAWAANPYFVPGTSFAYEVAMTPGWSPSLMG